MARIRKIEIENFRGIKALSWCPSPGINCLIGPGDSGKSSILDAIDFCLGTRRNIQFTDADFHNLNVETPIRISITLGELDEGLLNFGDYGMYLRSFNEQSKEVEDEPEKNGDPALTLRLTVTSDLEPSRSLVSKRAEAEQKSSRNLNPSDRARIAPAWIGVGATANYHLSWRRDSVLNRISEERANPSAVLATAGRAARTTFSQEAQDQLDETLDIITNTAQELGIQVGENLKAMLDAHSVSFNSGGISLHDENGIPLRGLGIGSKRLLVAGLQRKATAQSMIILIDELEYGLEPHRIIRLLESLGAKQKKPPLQVFMTTHAPVALRELTGNQIFVTRPEGNKHNVRIVGTADNIQGTIRRYPDAFLATSVIVCEGATEVGLVRGLDQYRTSKGGSSINAKGVALVDCGGGAPDRIFGRAATFHDLGYRVSIVRDSDKTPTPEVEEKFIADGGEVIAWRDKHAIEDELFLSLSSKAVGELINRAIELYGGKLIDDNVKSACQGTKDLSAIQTELQNGDIAEDSRTILGKAAKSGTGWFKSITCMEDIARDIVGPNVREANSDFREAIKRIFTWTDNAK